MTYLVHKHVAVYTILYIKHIKHKHNYYHDSMSDYIDPQKIISKKYSCLQSVII